MTERPMPAISARASDPLANQWIAHRAPAKRPQNAGKWAAGAAAGRLEHQSSSVCRRCDSAAPSASRIGPSSKRSTSSAMKPSITSRVELA